MNRIAATPPVPAPLAAAQAAPRPRHLGAVNWLGLWTLTAKEIRRFLKVYMQTVAGAGGHHPDVLGDFPVVGG